MYLDYFNKHRGSFCLIAIMTFMLAIFAYGSRTYSQAQARNQIVTGELSIVDDQGKIRARLGSDEFGPFLTLNDRTGSSRLRLRLEDDVTVEAVLYRSDSKPGLSLQLLENGESLIEFFGERDKNILRLMGKPDGSSAMLLSDDVSDESSSFVGVKMDPSGNSDLSFFSRGNQRPQLHMELSKGGTPRLCVSDINEALIFDVKGSQVEVKDQELPK